MAYIDGLLQYSAAQALTVSAASTNIVDHTKDRDIGIGEPMAVCFTIDTVFAGTAPTLQATVQASPNANMSSPVAVASSGVFAAPAAGFRFYVAIPPDASFDRYSNVTYVIGGSGVTGAVTANLIPLRLAQADQQGAGSFTVQ